METRFWAMNLDVLLLVYEGKLKLKEMKRMRKNL
jgi:hypothetical protein